MTFLTLETLKRTLNHYRTSADHLHQRFAKTAGATCQHGIAELTASILLDPLACNETSLDSILNNYSPLKETLEDIAADGTAKSDIRSKANGFMKLIGDFFYGLHFPLTSSK